MSINSFKVISSLVIFALNTFSSFLPFCLNTQSWVSYAESLAGGVFLGAFAVHLFPEAIHSFHSYTHAPIGPIISLIFFTILLTVELFASSHGHDHDNHACKHNCKHQNENTSNKDANKNLSNLEISNSQDNDIDDSTNFNKSNRDYSNDDSKMLIRQNESRFTVEDEIENLDDFRNNNLSTAKSKYAIKSTTLVVYFVLIFHCIIEAFGFGLLKSRSLLIALFCAIIGHKPVETFSMGILLLQSISRNGQNKRTNEAPINSNINSNGCNQNHGGFSMIRKFHLKRYCFMMIIFSSVTPLTILFSMYFGSGINSPLTFGIIASASAGVFMFVGFHELSELLEESGKWNAKAKIFHILWFVIGLGWMALIGLFSEEHEH